MRLRRGTVVLSLLVVSATAPGVVSCKKKTSDALDGGASDGAASTDASAASDDAAVTEGNVAATAVATAATADAPPLPRPTPFTGSYQCLKGLQLLQVGNIVTSTIHKDATTDTVLACTATLDTCTGTMRDIQNGRGKSPKVLNVRPITLVRTHNGDILLKLTPADKNEKHEKSGGGGRRSSSSTKPASGDETFCPHRS
jgi:hypothetical protein